MEAVTDKTSHQSYLKDFEEFRGQERVEPASVAQRRQEAIERFVELGFPTTRQEEWRFTNVAPIARTRFQRRTDAPSVKPHDLEGLAYPGCIQVVFVDGRLSPELSELAQLPTGAVVASLRETLAREPQDAEAFLGRHARFAEHPFVALNTALFDDGAFVLIRRGTVVEKPIHLLFLSHGGNGVAPVNYLRNLIVAETSTQATVIESYVGLGSGGYFNCGVTEIVGEANSVLDHYKVQKEGLEAFHVTTQQLYLERDANFASHNLSHGGRLVRNDVNAILDAEGIDCTLNGLYVANGRQHVDNHMRVEHAKPHCDSHELYKGILDGHSRAVFNGRIYVHPQAQKTDAKQTNRNLLLSKDALVNSNPQLEIFADDVKCTHGSTVGQLDNEALFYLRSRGINEEAARGILTYAFASELVERIRVEPLRAELEEFLFARLPGGEVVRQAV